MFTFVIHIVSASPDFLSSFFFSSRRRHTIFSRDWSSDVCSSDLGLPVLVLPKPLVPVPGPYVKALLPFKRPRRPFSCRYNGRRPHRGLELKTPNPRPDPAPWPAEGAHVRTRNVLGGLVHEYDLAA